MARRESGIVVAGLLALCLVVGILIGMSDLRPSVESKATTLRGTRHLRETSKISGNHLNLGAIEEHKDVARIWPAGAKVPAESLLARVKLNDEVTQSLVWPMMKQSESTGLWGADPSEKEEIDAFGDIDFNSFWTGDSSMSYDYSYSYY